MGEHHHHPHTYADRPHPEFVALDIGEGAGALIVYAEASLHGVEVEISPDGDDAARSHKEVLERRMGDEPAFTAVFDRLAPGRYTLWVHDEPRARGVEITDGTITELDWQLAAVK